MSARKRRALIHIGTEKTGSSSIQAALQALRAPILGSGVAYPHSPGGRNHTRLALYAAGGDGANRGLARQEERVSGRSAARIDDWLPAALAEELDALPEDVHTVILSNEHLHSRVRSPEQIGKLKGLLDAFFDDYRIVAYLRRQDELAVSRYSTRLRTGGMDERILPAPSEGPVRNGYYDHAGLLDRWGEAFGRAALLPRIFARGELLEGDVVKDFLAQCGLPGLSPPERPASGPMLQAAAQEFLRRFNLVFAPPGGGTRSRRLTRFLDREFAGTGRLPTRAEAVAFYGLFAEGNERIRREFFPDREGLFGTDFSRYPEVAGTTVPDEAVLEVARAAVAHLESIPRRRLANRPEEGAALEAARTVVAELASGTEGTAPPGRPRLGARPPAPDGVAPAREQRRVDRGLAAAGRAPLSGAGSSRWRSAAPPGG